MFHKHVEYENFTAQIRVVFERLPKTCEVLAKVCSLQVGCTFIRRFLKRNLASFLLQAKLSLLLNLICSKQTFADNIQSIDIENRLEIGGNCGEIL